MELLAPKHLILYTFAASALYVHFRGRVRHGFWRQLTNLSTFLAPYNTLMYLFSRVSTRPILDVGEFPELDVLRDNWRTIRAEAEQLYAHGNIQKSETNSDASFNSFFKKGWKRFYVKWYDDILPTAKELCPKTADLVQSIPSINAALFAMLAPHSRLPLHRDPFAGSLRYHLGLITPNSDDCRIYIDGTPYSWRDGEAVIWDETYIHRAVNETDEHRIILFCDIARPLRTPVMRAINRFMSRYIVKITAGRNVDTEKIGVVNRISGPLYALRKKAKRVKRSHRTLYYTSSYAGKIALVFGLLYLVFSDRLHGS